MSPPRPDGATINKIHQFGNHLTPFYPMWWTITSYKWALEIYKQGVLHSVPLPSAPSTTLPMPLQGPFLWVSSRRRDKLPFSTGCHRTSAVPTQRERLLLQILHNPKEKWQMEDLASIWGTSMVCQTAMVQHGRVTNNNPSTRTKGLSLGPWPPKYIFPHLHTAFTQEISQICPEDGPLLIQGNTLLAFPQTPEFYPRS